MIRFACPGCGAAYELPDDNGGKSAACPKCQSQFTIPPPQPAADAPPPLPPVPPPTTAPGTVEIAPCPGCQARLSVAAADVGLDIQCPHCQRVYRAVAAAGPAAASKAGTTPARLSRRKRDDGDDDAHRGRRKWDDDDDRPSRRGSRRPKEDRPSEVGVIAALLLSGGIYALVYTPAAGVTVGLMSCGLGCLWPGFYLAFVWGIMAIVRATSILNRTDVGGAPQTLCILQIVTIVNGDVVNMTLGIIGMVMLNNPAVREYYDRVAPPRD